MTILIVEKIENDGMHEPLQAPARAARREIESMQLFGGSKELLIRHDGEYYTLRRTSKGKLILTK
jgi:hemin uptake protein HemP